MQGELPVPVDEAEVRRLDAYVEERRHRRQGNKILHRYPPPLLWRRRDIPVDDVMALGRQTAATVRKRLIASLATPFCLPTDPEHCGFCLFPSEVYRQRSQLDEYLRFLDLEERLSEPHLAGARLDRLYFGGSTENLYLPHHYQALLDLVRLVLGSIPPEAKVTLEGVPQLFTREKLAAMHAAGRSAFARDFVHELPSRDANLEMYRQVKDCLEAAGYRQRTVYDWELHSTGPPSTYRFEDSWHRPLRSEGHGQTSGVEMWGSSFAGVSSFLGAPDSPGWTFVNHSRTRAYLAELEEGRFPIERGFAYDERGLRLNVLFQMLHRLEIDLDEVRRLFGIHVLAAHAETWSALMRCGRVFIEENRLCLVGDGAFQTALTQTLLTRSPSKPYAT